MGRLHFPGEGRTMTDFEWPPDEIAGPAEETRPADAKPATARASVSVPGSTAPQSGNGGAPQAGVPVSIPQPISPASAPDGFRASAPVTGRASLADPGRSPLADAF